MPVSQIQDDVYEIQIGQHDMLTVFLILDENPTLVDAATAETADEISSAFKTIGLDPSALSNVIISHVHLDHSGATADLVDNADDLDVYIHESTAHHLVNPENLIESTKSALGDEFKKMGAPDPLARDQIKEVPSSGMTLDIGNYSLEIVHTPGHSPDHLSVIPSDATVMFANEAIGRYYPRADCWIPPTTVPNFDAEAVANSIELLSQVDQDTVGLSHTGTMMVDKAITRAQNRLDEFLQQIPAWYAETNDIEQTTSRVREQLLSFEHEYPERLVATQSRLCTMGILNSQDIL